MLGPANNTGSVEMSLRFAFRDALHQALQEQRPLEPIVTLFKGRYPDLAETLEADYLFELETGFKTDAEWEAEFHQIEHEEEARRHEMSRTEAGRLQLLLEDMEYEDLVEHAIDQMRSVLPAPAPAPLPERAPRRLSRASAPHRAINVRHLRWRRRAA